MAHGIGDIRASSLSQLLKLVKKTNSKGTEFIKIFKSVINQGLKALTYIHNVGVVHRDIKPDNFQVSGEAQQITLKLCDFGEARSSMINMRGKPLRGAARTQNVNRGTPAYMSHELHLDQLQVKGATLKELQATDLWF